MRHCGWNTIMAAAAAASALAAASPARAGYDAEYVFGDSLSDRGNLAEAFGANFPNPPSFHDSFTNGPVAVQLLAQSLGLNADPSLWVTGFKDVHGLFGGASYVPGTSYAVAGATAAGAAVGGPANINLPQQVAAYSAFSGLKADPSALYVVFIGGNDVRNATLRKTGAPAVTAGVNAELSAISTLAGEGAKSFLVVNVPDVGVIPEFTSLGAAASASATSLSVAYDQKLATGLASLEPGLPAGDVVHTFDLFGFNEGIAANAAAYGFTNTTDPCFTTTPFSAATTAACGPGAANIGSFIYWDQIHPTAGVHALWAEGLEAAVPEGSTLPLLAGALPALAFLRRRRG